jgi:transcriptional regulator with XRE-family HTH domain
LGNMYDRIAAARKALGLTQKEMANRSGIALRTYCRYESGEGERDIPSSLLTYVAQNGIDVNWLLTGEGAMFQHTQESEAELNDGILGGGFADLAESIGTLEENLSAETLKDFYAVMDTLPPKLREELLLATKRYYERNTVEGLAREVEQLKKELAELKTGAIERTIKEEPNK